MLSALADRAFRQCCAVFKDFPQRFCDAFNCLSVTTYVGIRSRECRLVLLRNSNTTPCHNLPRVNKRAGIQIPALPKGNTAVGSPTSSAKAHVGCFGLGTKRVAAEMRRRAACECGPSRGKPGRFTVSAAELIRCT